MKPQNYRGYTIDYSAGYYWAVGKPYPTLNKAKEAIDYLLDVVNEID